MTSFRTFANRSPPSSRPATPLFHNFRHFASFDSLDEDDRPFRSRARPGRIIPMDFDSVDAHSASFASGHRHQTTRFASSVRSERPEQYNKSIHPAEDNLVKEKDVAFTPVERSGENNENAWVWQVYVEEAAKADQATIDGWNRSIDVLLVFTGLFSAVLTTFIIQSYQMMLLSPADTTNALLAQILAQQKGIDNPVPLPSNGNPSSTSRTSWVNGLWFAALACSLSTALIAMLAKQWLQAYLPNSSGSAHERARLRQFRYMQLEAWHVPAIINALPLLLHIALLLFFAGLIILLWSTSLGITVATWVIVAIVYLFYCASICLPLIYPHCPYHHPISDHLRHWITPSTLSSTADPETDIQLPAGATAKTGIPISEDNIDATALAWLFTKTTDSAIRTAALQGIAGLPRDFSALEALRKAGAVHLVEDGFRQCFQRDTAGDLRWHVIDVEGAELYCRAWLNLTTGTAQQWPMDILEPLWLLQDLRYHVDAAAIASCAVAMSSLDSMHAQWEVISYLGRHTSGRLQLSHTTLCWVLESLIECVVRWEMPIAVTEQTTAMVVPILLRLLHQTQDLPLSDLRSAVALALYMFVCNTLDPEEYRTTEKRCAEYCRLTIQALASIVETPQRFGVKSSLLDSSAQELARLSSPLLNHPDSYPDELRNIAKSALTKLYIDEKLAIGMIPDSTLADVLHLIFPPSEVPVDRQPVYITSLIENLEISSHPDIITWSVRGLEVLLSRCSLAVSQAFVDNDGINVVLRAAKVGNVDSGRLQITSLRTLCAFIYSSTSSYMNKEFHETEMDYNQHFDQIFRSDFFNTLSFVLASRRTIGFKQPQAWWLSEVGFYWLPALTRLCRIRPQEAVWSSVVSVIRDFAETNEELGYSQCLAGLDEITKSARIVESQ